MIAGDGIGKAVMPEGTRVLEAVADKFNIPLQFDHFDFSSWDYFEAHVCRYRARDRDAGKAIANPIGQIWSGAMMLDFLGFKAAHDAVINAIELVLAPGGDAPLTPDLGGSASTTDLGRAIARQIGL